MSLHFQLNQFNIFVHCILVPKRPPEGILVIFSVIGFFALQLAYVFRLTVEDRSQYIFVGNFQKKYYFFLKMNST